MTGFERISSAPPVSATTPVGATGDAGSTARGAMATVGERILAWSAQSFGTGPAAGAAWCARTGSGDGFSPDRAELSRGGDVYQLRALTGEIAARFGATPAQEGALGRAIGDFARGVALRFNALAGGDTAPMLDGIANALDRAAASGGSDGIDGVTARIESAATWVGTLNH